MASTINIQKALLSPPGDTIQEHIDFIGMSQVELAERMGRPKEKINDIIKGRDPISTETAYQLENVLGIPAKFWISREESYRQKLYELTQQERYEQEKSWLQQFPVNDMRKLGWLPNTKEIHILVDTLLKFFAVASTEEWDNIYLHNATAVSFRASLAHTKNPHAIAAWLRKGEIELQHLNLPEFHKKIFQESLYKIKELAFVMPQDYKERLRAICAESGVAVVFTPNLSQAPISGAVRWVLRKPLIQVSDRWKTSDQFWFTFFHEAAHIILHGKKDVFLENVEGSEINSTKELEADTFAANILLPASQEEQIISAMPLNEEKILAFAQQFQTPAGVIVGRLQHEKKIPFNRFNNVKQRITFS